MAQKLTLLSVLWIAVAIVVSEASDPPVAPTTPGASATPEAPTTPGASITPEASTTPGTPATPGASTTPETPAPPETPATPGPTGPSPGTQVTQTDPTGPESSATEDPSTTNPLDACASNPCGDGSTCEKFGESYRCMCLAGDSYSEETQTCMKAKVFPGQLSGLSGLPPYSTEMSDTTSEIFRSTAETITGQLDKVFNENATYTGSTVVEITKAASRQDTIIASVQIAFEANSEVTLNDIEKEMKDAKLTFKETDLCEALPCDERTSTCKSTEGSFTCSCKDDYVKTTYSDRICVECPSGSHVVDSKCEKCSFGYSGFNCKDNWQLVLVITGSVLGGLLLISLILLPVVALKSSKKSSKKNKDVDIGKPYVSHSSAKAPLVNNNLANSQPAPQNGSASAFANAGVPRIPRATTNSAWDSRTNLEMTPSHSRQNLISEGRNSRPYDDQDDTNTYALSRQNSQYAQRPQSNPYGQNRAQFNPYAQNQGHSNPYYMQDSGRRLH